jgi:uncharacterized protein
MEKLTEIILHTLKEKKPTGVIEITYDDVLKKMALLNSIVFEVTEVCNLDCYYCTYGNLYKVRGKKEKRIKKMSSKTMKNAFNFFLQQWNQEPYGNTLNIGFYGGEPLINMDLIKKTVEHTRILFPNSKLNFRLTTNGLLLDKHLEFFVENDFKIMVSLDGNKNHNSYRITREGKNPFENIIKNLDLIYLKYSDYFKNNIAINSVLHNKNEPNAVIDFFLTKYDKAPFLSKLADTDINEDERMKFNELNIFREYVESNENLDFNEEFIQSKWGRTILFFLKIIEMRYHNLSELVYQNSSGKLMTGSCLPFERVFILTDGTILPCERSNHNNRLGNVNHMASIDIKSIVKKYNSFLKTLEISNCNSCADRNSCQACIFQIGKINLKEPVKCSKNMTQSQFVATIDQICAFITANPNVINSVRNILTNGENEE